MSISKPFILGILGGTVIGISLTIITELLLLIIVAKRMGNNEDDTSIESDFDDGERHRPMLTTINGGKHKM